MDVWPDDLPQDAAPLPLLGDKARIAELEAENATLRADFAALMAKAASVPMRPTLSAQGLSQGCAISALASQGHSMQAVDSALRVRLQKDHAISIEELMAKAVEPLRLPTSVAYGAPVQTTALPPDHLIESATEHYAWWGFPPRPISALPTTHTACRHCGAAFLAEVVSTHEATCELRPDEKVEL